MACANNDMVTGRKPTRRTTRSKVGCGSGEAYEAEELNV